MHASECKRYAEICRELVRDLPLTHQPLLLDMAHRWLEVARDLEREEAGDVDDKQERREQREEKVIGLLSRKVEDVISERFPDGAFEQSKRAQRDAEVRQHAGRQFLGHAPS